MNLANDLVPRHLLWGLLQEYGLSGLFFNVIQSLYEQSESCACILGVKLKPLKWVSEYILSALLFVVFMDRVSRHSKCWRGVQYGGLR